MPKTLATLIVSLFLLALPVAAFADGTKCRALDDGGKTIAEADDKLSTKCTRLLLDALKKQWCTADNKGKKFDYTSEFDHVIGQGKLAKKMPAKKQSLTCHTVAK